MQFIQKRPDVVQAADPYKGVVGRRQGLSLGIQPYTEPFHVPDDAVIHGVNTGEVGRPVGPGLLLLLYGNTPGRQQILQLAEGDGPVHRLGVGGDFGYFR